MAASCFFSDYKTNIFFKQLAPYLSNFTIYNTFLTCKNSPAKQKPFSYIIILKNLTHLYLTPNYLLGSITSDFLGVKEPQSS